MSWLPPSVNSGIGRPVSRGAFVFLRLKSQQPAHPSTGTLLEFRLEALERINLNTELILFGIKELPSEDPGSVATSIAAALHIAVSPDDVVASYRIPARGDRPRPLVLKLSS